MNISNDDYKLCMDKFKDDTNAFLFCDPPYFGSDNTDYNSHGSRVDKNNKIIDNTEIFVYLSQYIKNCKCKIMIVINDNALLRFLFDGYIKKTYNKIYQLVKNKDTLMVITNYNI